MQKSLIEKNLGQPVDISDFHFEVVNARASNPREKRIVQASYQLWASVWTEALTELEGSAKLPSDDFSRQEQVGALFYKDEVVGTLFFSRVDLSLPIWRNDSYFSPWPKEILDQVATRYKGMSVLVCSYFTLASEWRRDAAGFSAKRLLTSLGVEQLMHSEMPVMVGTMRVNRNMHSICYEVGAKALLKDAQHHGVAVDLITFDKSEIRDQNILGPMTIEARKIYAKSKDARVLAFRPEQEAA